jgi:hypothetical protein
MLKGVKTPLSLKMRLYAEGMTASPQRTAPKGPPFLYLTNTKREDTFKNVSGEFLDSPDTFLIAVVLSTGIASTQYHLRIVTNLKNKYISDISLKIKSVYKHCLRCCVVGALHRR